MYKLIIFDLDGTLLDTLDDLANSMNHALKVFDFPAHKRNAYRTFIGNGIIKLVERALPIEHNSQQTIEQVKLEFLKHYYQHTDVLTRPYDGIEALMHQLYVSGYKLAIASNKIHQATVELSKRFFPNIEFFEVLGHRDGYPPKPNPAILYEIIANANIDKSQVLYVGDSGVDAATAVRAGIDFVGVLWGFRTSDELIKQGAEILIREPKELLRIVV